LLGFQQELLKIDYKWKMSKNKKICHITTVHPPFDQRIFYRECISLTKKYQTTLICHYDEKDSLKNNVHILSLGKYTTKTLRIKFIQRVISNLMAFVKGLINHYSIFHIHDPELIIVGFLLKKFSRTKIIFDCHEDYSGYILQRVGLGKYQRLIFSITFRFLERIATKNFDAIITADRGMKEKFDKLGAKKVEVIFNFPLIDLFPFEVEPDNTEYDLVYNGSIPRYHLLTSFSVAELLIKKGFPLKWYFFGRSPELNWATAEISKRNLKDFFFILPPVPHDQVANEIRKAKIGFIPLPDLPKFQHNIPTKLFEFMALGMPAVLSNLPPSREFVGDGKCAIMVNPNDPNAYAEAIIELINDRQKRIEMGLEGRRRVEEGLNWTQEEQKLFQVYSELLS